MTRCNISFIFYNCVNCFWPSQTLVGVNLVSFTQQTLSKMHQHSNPHQTGGLLCRLNEFLKEGPHRGPGRVCTVQVAHLMPGSFSLQLPLPLIPNVSWGPKNVSWRSKVRGMCSDLSSLIGFTPFLQLPVFWTELWNELLFCFTLLHIIQNNSVSTFSFGKIKGWHDCLLNSSC